MTQSSAPSVRHHHILPSCWSCGKIPCRNHETHRVIKLSQKWEFSWGRFYALLFNLFICILNVNACLKKKQKHWCKQGLTPFSNTNKNSGYSGFLKSGKCLRSLFPTSCTKTFTATDASQNGRRSLWRTLPDWMTSYIFFLYVLCLSVCQPVFLYITYHYFLSPHHSNSPAH